MSSQANHYVLYGVSVPYDALDEDDDSDRSYDLISPYEDSAFDDKVNTLDNVTILSDGLSGSYMLIGHVITKTDLHDGFPGVVSLDPHEASRPGWEIDVTNVLNKLGLDPANYTMGWFVVSHYR